MATDRQLQEINRRGRAVGQRGKTIADNPYANATLQGEQLLKYQAWVAGWRTGHRERKQAA